jgi:hypothetical protein
LITIYREHLGQMKYGAFVTNTTDETRTWNDLMDEVNEHCDYQIINFQSEKCEEVFEGANGKMSLCTFVEQIIVYYSYN